VAIVLQKIIVLFIRVYFILFALFALRANHDRLNVALVLQILFISLLVFWRLKKDRQIPVVPDIFLFALPYLWLISLYDSVYSWFPQWQIPFLSVFALSFFSGKLQELKATHERSVFLGTVFAAGFVLVYAILLHNSFAQFDDKLFKTALLNVIAFFSALLPSYLCWSRQEN
jgi:uncharacterized membrane protein YbaN (DUF454 family)